MLRDKMFQFLLTELVALIVLIILMIPGITKLLAWITIHF